MSDIAHQRGGSFRHVLELGLEYLPKAPGETSKTKSEVVRVAAFVGPSLERCLLLAFANGSFQQFGTQRADNHESTLEWQATWELPTEFAGGITALTIHYVVGAGTAPAGIRAFFGTDCGWLGSLRLQESGAKQGQVDHITSLGQVHKPASVRAIAVGAEGLDSPDNVSATLLSADIVGRILRTQIPACGPEKHVAKTEVLAELQSPVLSIELSGTGSLLVSTAERIVVLETATVLNENDRAPEMRYVGTKPHKGKFTAAFTPAVGRDALIAARPGGRLWVADGATGTVQSTLRFKRDGAGADDRVALGRLLALGGDLALSWVQFESAGEDAPTQAAVCDPTASNPVSLLDLQAISICQEWTLPPIVDAVCWGSDRVILAHRDSLSVLLMRDSALEMAKGIVEDGLIRYRTDSDFLRSCLQSITALQEKGLATANAHDALTALQPLIEVVADLQSLDVNTPDSSELAAFASWVTDLEDRVISEQQDGRHMIPSFMVTALANFPVTEGTEMIDNVAQKVPSLDCADAIVECWGETSSTIPAVFVGQEWQKPLEPRLLLNLATEHLAEPCVAKNGSMTLAESFELPMRTDSVDCALRIVPFEGNSEVLSYFGNVLKAITAALRFDVLQAGAVHSPKLVEAVCSAFDLLCLHVCGIPGGKCRWPLLGLAPDATDQTQEEQRAIDIGVVQSRLSVIQQTIFDHISALAETGLNEEVSDGIPEVVSEACKKQWDAPTALALCKAVFGSRATPGIVLERCLFRVNGLIPAGADWLQVQKWLMARMPLARAPNSANEWATNLERLSAAVDSWDIASSCAAVHSFLAGSFGFRRSSGEFDATTRRDAAALLRDAVHLALRAFPKILPCNLDLWTRSDLRGDSFSMVGSRPVETWELIAGEFLQYLLRLIPTGKTLPDFAALLNSILVALLQRYKRGDAGVELHSGNSLVANNIIKEYHTMVSTSQLQKIAYPLGILKLAAIQGVSAADSIDLVLQTLLDHSCVPVLSLNRNGPAQKHNKLYSCRCPSSAHLLPTDAGERTSHSTQQRPSCVSVGDLELAQWLRRAVAADDGVQHLLDAIINALVVIKSWRAGSADIKQPLDKMSPSPMERLLIALAAGSPDRIVGHACRKALAANVLTDLAATDIARTFWSEALRPTVDVAENALEKSTWLKLPGPTEPPEPPDPPPRPGENSLGWLSSGPAGFYTERPGKLVEFSDYGLVARHLDDTGELMCGVLQSWGPLEVDRAGLYFEVEILEVRPGPCCDGLTIGVTCTPPEQVTVDYPSVEHVPRTWAMGYDGQMWDAEAEILSSVDWDPRCLREGDTVGVLVTLAEGELIIFQNGVACCPGPRSIPVASTPVYAIVDLLGTARSIRWRIGAVPPIGEGQ